VLDVQFLSFNIIHWLYFTEIYLSRIRMIIFVIR